jgi:hypothetical protein
VQYRGVPQLYRKALEIYGALGLTAKISIALAMVLLTTLLGVAVVVWLPADHFRPRPVHGPRHPVARWSLIVMKNVLGLAILPVGLFMLVGPGPGIVVTLVSLSLLDFPGKRSLERKLLARKNVMRVCNELRATFGKPPLAVDID